MNKELFEMSKVVQGNIENTRKKLEILYQIKKSGKIDIKIDFNSNWNPVRLDYVLEDESGHEMIKQLLIINVDNAIAKLEEALAALVGYKGGNV